MHMTMPSHIETQNYKVLKQNYKALEKTCKQVRLAVLILFMPNVTTILVAATDIHVLINWMLQVFFIHYKNYEQLRTTMNNDKQITANQGGILDVQNKKNVFVRPCARDLLLRADVYPTVSIGGNSKKGADHDTSVPLK